MFCITSRRDGDNAKQHRLYYIVKQSSVCFFHMFDRLFFIMIMNRLHCEGRMLKCVRMRRWSNHWIYSLPTAEATPLSHEDNRNCKRSAFICVHSIKKLSLLFCKIRKKIECIFLPSALISRSTIMNKLHTLENTGFKTTNLGWIKEYIWG